MSRSEDDHHISPLMMDLPIYPQIYSSRSLEKMIIHHGIFGAGFWDKAFLGYQYTEYDN